MARATGKPSVWTTCDKVHLSTILILMVTIISLVTFRISQLMHPFDDVQVSADKECDIKTLTLREIHCPECVEGEKFVPPTKEQWAIAEAYIKHNGKPKEPELNHTKKDEHRVEPYGPRHEGPHHDEDLEDKVERMLLEEKTQMKEDLDEEMEEEKQRKHNEHGAEVKHKSDDEDDLCTVGDSLVVFLTYESGRQTMSTLLHKNRETMKYDKTTPTSDCLKSMFGGQPEDFEDDLNAEEDEDDNFGPPLKKKEDEKEEEEEEDEDDHADTVDNVHVTDIQREGKQRAKSDDDKAMEDDEENAENSKDDAVAEKKRKKKLPTEKVVYHVLLEMKASDKSLKCFDHPDHLDHADQPDRKKYERSQIHAICAVFRMVVWPTAVVMVLIMALIIKKVCIYQLDQDFDLPSKCDPFPQLVAVPVNEKNPAVLGQEVGPGLAPKDKHTVLMSGPVSGKENEAFKTLRDHVNQAFAPLDDEMKTPPPAYNTLDKY